MPRTTIDLPYQVEHISILDEDGNLDHDLEPDLSEEFLLRLHRYMLLGRRFDERMLKLQRQGRIGTFAPIQGQEASQLGSVAALRDSDWMAPAFRESAAQLWRGQSMESFLLYYGGYFRGGEIPEGIRNLPVAIPVGTQILHAVGLGYAIKVHGQDDVAMVFFGDGATSEGDFHEAVNNAGVFKTPTIFVCQNNQYAISIPRSHQTQAKTLAQKALAYGVPGIQTDGNDILAVYVAAIEAVERARAGEGPTLIENVTYRLSVHTTADDPTRYRDEEEVAVWEKREPISRFQRYLKDKGMLTDNAITALEDEIKDEIAEAVDKAEERMETLKDEAITMFDHLYAERPAYLEEQRQAFAAHWEKA
ncbi:MAG: pyruvate dehydrogenase (acetyl-transferring) E1 component subunit alpha [Anaerolineae bacterium]|nr:pyruvate dehydrogenase (acetyl-transferring) E1 component subunit alpha [Anaerolineae bacterium]